MSAKLDDAARAGFEGQLNGNLYSSPVWYAHELGRYLARTGAPCPTDVHMGRGYSMRVGLDVLYRIDGGQTDPRFTRIKG